MADAVPNSFASVSDVGRQRQRNEDNHGELVLGDDLLLVVCDGMGGHEAGEVASAIAVEQLTAAFKGPLNDPREALYQGFIAANEEIIRQAQQQGRRGMGTTGVAAFVRGREAFVAHVGDSRLYHLRNGEIVFRTKDHTRVQKMVDMGIITPEQARDHPESNVINRALGHPVTPDGTPLEPDVRSRPLELKAGDTLLLCSDGLYDMVEDHELAGVIAGRTAQEAAQALVDLANERGGDDNITVTIFYCAASRGPVVLAGSSPSVAAPATTTSGSTAPYRPAFVKPPAQAATNRMPLVLVAVGLVLLGGIVFYATRPGPEAPAPAVTQDDPSEPGTPEDDEIPPEYRAAVAGADGGETVVDAGQSADAGKADAGQKADAGGVVPAQASTDAGR